VPSIGYALASTRATLADNSLPTADELSATFENVADTIRPSVVAINSIKRVEVAQNAPGQADPFQDFFNDPMMRRFFQFQAPAPHDYVQRGLGTGVIVSEDGYILTNNHVVGGADEVEVKLPDNRTLHAKVVGTDKKTDLAVLKVDAVGLHPAKLGDSDGLRVGEWVLAAGNPFGFNSTITAGIVSATGRSNVGLEDYEDFIQTDAAINPGNSGGPLVDMHGDVIGINTAIYSRSGGYMGIGFAIPSNLAQSVMNSLIKNGHVVRGWLGVEIQDLNPGLAQSFGYKGTNGALVGDVTPDGPADHAGLQRGDIIERFDGKDVKNVAKLRDLAAAAAPKSRVDVQVWRDGRSRNFRVDMGEMPGSAVAANGGIAHENLGMTTQTLTAEAAHQLGLPPGTHGVLVTDIAPMGLAEQGGVRPNDVIVTVQGTPVENADQFRTEMAKHDLKQGVRLEVITQGQRRFVFLQSDGLS